ncbi:hypothetical protein MTO96_044155, partial [Rhipicephalus appendiculatus]
TQPSATRQDQVTVVKKITMPYQQCQDIKQQWAWI